MDDLKLNVPLLRKRVPSLTSAARSVGLRPATVSNLCTGKIPLGRAEVRTLAALATLAECSLDELVIRGNEGEMIETGIKTLDLFSPLTLGGTIGFVARPGMGQLVVLAEVFHRLKEKGYSTVVLMPNAEGEGISDITETAEIVCSSIEEAFEEISAVGQKKEVMLAADRSTVLTGEIYELQDRLQEANITSVTTFLVDPRGEAVDEIEPYGPLDTLLQFDAEMISRRLYPAVNPIQSTSTVLEGAYVDSTHMTIQQRARKVMRRYRELRFLVDAYGIDRMPDADVQIFNRGQRLEAYLTQPFYVAEEFTKMKGVSVPLQDTLNDVRRILDGAADGLEVNTLMWSGTLDEILAKPKKN
ncbi:hypothetical protein [Pseudalkalibacillus caeni]|uniref:ATP synthase subunit B n=1 Tax=Exobacillus caeni TaxID=2574798 RepID=A0A5R9EZB2_9BACL|nr:hypothetical protein [Pseudalkalibacillus caeni]TLS36547.1 hypothetical protein FCL54_15170 [Pseudalkalibacillus caeni]